jgi:hypothetical protein
VQVRETPAAGRHLRPRQRWRPRRNAQVRDHDGHPARRYPCRQVQDGEAGRPWTLETTPWPVPRKQLGTVPADQEPTGYRPHWRHQTAPILPTMSIATRSIRRRSAGGTYVGVWDFGSGSMHKLGATCGLSARGWISRLLFGSHPLFVNVKNRRYYGYNKQVC